MPEFFYTGSSTDTKSGLSWKIWRIRRSGQTVTISWGRAAIEKRRPVPVGALQSKTLIFRTEAAARSDVERRIAAKLTAGYERTPGRKRRATTK